MFCWCEWGITQARQRNKSEPVLLKKRSANFFCITIVVFFSKRNDCCSMLIAFVVRMPQLDLPSALFFFLSLSLLQRLFD